MARFIITHDMLDARDVRLVVGYSNSRQRELEDSSLAQIAALEGAQFFRLKDDDGEVYYTGFYFGDVNSEDAFAPLDWAANEAGCTSIEYQAHGFKPL